MACSTAGGRDVYAALVAAFVSIVAPAQSERLCFEWPVIYNFGEPGWVQSGGTGIITSMYGYHSAPIAGSLSGDGSTVPGGLEIAVDYLIPGMHYSIRAWLNANAADEAFPVRISIGLPNEETYVFETLKSSIGPGWQLVELGTFDGWHSLGGFLDSQRVLRANLAFPGGPLGGPPVVGRWGVDDIEIESFEEAEMTKRREIREALVAKVASVTIANGYTLTINEVKTGPIRFPDGIGTWPHANIKHGDEVEVIQTLGRKTSTITYHIGVACKRTDTEDADDQCDDACGEIEKAIELGPNDPGAAGRWLGLAYVTNVFVVGVDPVDLSPEMARDAAAWEMTVEVTYSHMRRQP